MTDTGAGGGQSKAGSGTIELDHTPTADEEADAFGRSEAREELRLINAKRELENRQFERDMSNREDFAEKAFGITQAWLGMLFVLIFVQVLKPYLKIGLTDREFITVVTTTTASVFGFWLLVGRYLFSKEAPTPASQLRAQPGRRTKGTRKGK